MEKALKMGRTSAIGSWHLFLGRTVSTIIMAIGTIVLGMFILESDYGLYTVALIPVTTFLLFQDWGVGSALTRHCAKCRAANDEKDLRKTIMACLAFNLATGTILTIVSLATSFFIATVIFQKPESAYLIFLTSVTILASAFANVASSVFVGFEKMKLSSAVLLVGAIVQSLFAPLLVLFGFGALGAIVGYTLGIVVSATMSMAILFFSIIRKLPPSHMHRSDLLVILRPFLNFGIPLAAATISGGLGIQFISFMMASFCDNSTIGAYKIALNFSILLTFLRAPITTVLFPAFSKIHPQKELHLLKAVFKTSTKYTSFLVVPSTLAAIVLGNSLIGTLYGNKWVEAPLYLILILLTNLSVLLGNISASSLLTALGQTKFLFKVNLLYILVSVILSLILIPTFGMIGVLMVSLVSAFPGLFVIFYILWRRYNLIPDMKDSGKIIFASLAAFLPTYIFERFSVFTFSINLIVGLICFLGVFIVTAPLVGAINQIDIGNLRAMFSESLILSKILNIPLKIFEKILRIKDR